MTSPHEDWKSLACQLNISRASAVAANESHTTTAGDNSTLLMRVAICQWGDQQCTGSTRYPDPPPVPNVYACNSSDAQMCCNNTFRCPPTNACRCGNGSHGASHEFILSIAIHLTTDCSR